MNNKTFTNSIQLLGRGNIKSLTLDLSERQWIQSVQFEISGCDRSSYIVTTGSRQKLFNLKDNPEVTKFGEDVYYIHGLMKNHDTAEDIEVDVVYQVNESSGSVFKVPHLYISFEDGSDIFLYNETAETYYNILSVIQKNFPEIANGLFIKIDGTYKYFLSLEI